MQLPTPVERRKTIVAVGEIMKDCQTTCLKVNDIIKVYIFKNGCKRKQKEI